MTDPSGARTGPPSRPEPSDPLPPLKVALRPYAGPITVLALLLVCLLVGVAIVLLGARQPSIITSATDPPTETFAGPDSAALSKDWTTEGDWGVFQGTAALIKPAADKLTSSATLDVGSDVVVAAKLVGIDGLGGLLFRYQDQNNYGMFLPLPQFGTWQIRIVQGGKVVLDHNVGLQSTAEGVVGEVVVNGSAVVALIDNRVIEKVALPDGLNGTRVGIGSAPGASTTTRFDDFVGLSKADR